MSDYGLKWQRLLDWGKHLQRCSCKAPQNQPDRNNYVDGFKDAVNMMVKWMESEEVDSETKESYVYRDPISKGTWEGK